MGCCIRFIKRLVLLKVSTSEFPYMVVAQCLQTQHNSLFGFKSQRAFRDMRAFYGPQTKIGKWIFYKKRRILKGFLLKKISGKRFSLNNLWRLRSPSSVMFHPSSCEPVNYNRGLWVWTIFKYWHWHKPFAGIIITDFKSSLSSLGSFILKQQSKGFHFSYNGFWCLDLEHKIPKACLPLD